MNGFSTEEDSRDGPPAAPFYGQSCCLIDDGDRCVRPAGNASFSKRIQKSISQKKLKLDIDKSVSCGLRRSPFPPRGRAGGLAVPSPPPHCGRSLPAGLRSLRRWKVASPPGELSFAIARGGSLDPDKLWGEGGARCGRLCCRPGSFGPRFPLSSVTALGHEKNMPE